MGGRDDRRPLVDRLAGVEDDERIALSLERGERVVRLSGQQQKGTVRRPLEEPVEERDLALALVHRRAEDDVHVVLVERLRGAPENRAEVLDVDHGEGDADQPGPPAGERAGAAVHAEPLLVDDAEHGLRVLGETSGRPFRTRETVAIETPAASAMSRIVGGPFWPSAPPFPFR